MNLQLLLGIWAAVFIAYATVAVLRWRIGMREDDQLHVLDSEQQMLASQTTMAHKLDVLDRWKTGLLVLTIVMALVIGAMLAWNVWQQSSSTVQFG